MTIEMKWRITRETEDTVQAVVFVGEEGGTLQNAGTLRLRIGEYQLIGAALLLGQGSLRGLFKHTEEGGAKALAQTPEERRAAYLNGTTR